MPNYAITSNDYAPQPGEVLVADANGFITQGGSSPGGSTFNVPVIANQGITINNQPAVMNNGFIVNGTSYHLNGVSGLMTGGVFFMQNNAVINVSPSCGINVIGGNFSIGNAATGYIHNGGTLTVSNNGQVIWNNNSTATFNSGSNVNFNGTPINFSSGAGLNFTDLPVVTGASPQTANSRAGVVTFTGLDIGEGASTVVSILNNQIPNTAGTQVIATIYGGTPGSSLTLGLPNTSTPGQINIEIKNAQGSARNIDNVVIMFIVLN